jgi:beta-glucanase (GH16 family)
MQFDQASTLARLGLVRKKPFPCWTIALLLCFCGFNSYSQSVSGWQLNWSDEFDGPTVDAAKWGYEIGYLRNDELQYYSNRVENSSIQDGKLLIRALRDNWNGHEYTSASRTTKNKKSWTYGRFEIRAQIDIRMGSWPAWWWLPNTGGWPKGGEVDMMEFYQGKCLFNVMDGSQKWTSPTKTVASLGGERWAAEYHVWTMEWDSTQIDLSLDGVIMNHYLLEKADGTGPNGGNPFKQPGYIILNQALGGLNGGNPAGTVFPIDFRIDWIRVHTWTPGESYQVTVNGGSGSGFYRLGTAASITANMAPVGQEFDKWVVVSGMATPDDLNSATAKLTVSASNSTVAASYRSKGSGIFKFAKPLFKTVPILLPEIIDMQGRRHLLHCKNKMGIRAIIP